MESIQQPLNATAIKLIKRIRSLQKEQIEFHPVLLREYRFETPMIGRSYAIVRERVAARRTGIFFYGPPRLGKTTCAEEILLLLTKEFPRSYVLLISARDSQRPSDSHMFKLLLEGQNHTLASRTDTSLLLRNIKTDIQLEVGRRNGTQFVLIVDEMQLLSEMYLKQLLIFHNALSLIKIKMTTVAFAQPEIIDRWTALQTKNQSQIIARFLSEPLQFEGCSSIQELRSLLQLYDEHSRFPEESKISYTQFFFPEAFACGFRLANYTKKIWETLIKHVVSQPVSGLPMEHVCLTIEYLLLAYWKHDFTDFAFSEEDIDEAVEASNLRNFRAYVMPS